jgi:ribulose-5-phosphate 4-epimerase/fuculose-1-phosphate aldolase
MSTSPLTIPTLKSSVSAEEWRTRVDLAAAYRLVAAFKWDDLVFTHISARVPGTENQFLINPYGLLFDEITASSLVRIDGQGNKLSESPFEVNPAGFTIHSAVHSARHDAQCVVHTHTLNGIAVSAQKDGVLPISQQSIFVLSSLGYHDYEGVALRDDEKPRLVRDLGRNNFLMLRNHGLLTVGPTVADAFLAMYFFETVCTIQVRAMSGGAALTSVDPGIIETSAQQARQATRGMGAGALAWPGLLRRLNRADASYQD